MQHSVFLGRRQDFVNALDEDIRHANFVKMLPGIYCRLLSRRYFFTQDTTGKQTFLLNTIDSRYTNGHSQRQFRE